ncbi:MAG: hypothetical protein ACE5NG_03860 [bacterium]
MAKNNGNSISTLNVVDWSRQKRAVLNGEIDADTRIGEITSMAIHALDLPKNVPYSAFITTSDGQQEQKLNKSDTVGDAKLKDGTEMLIAPEVSAG